MKKLFIKELREKYFENNLVPFIGAGLSMPYGIPDWGTLIKDCAIELGLNSIDDVDFIPMIDLNLKTNDYWEAMNIIKKYANRSEQDIQSFVVKKILQSLPKDMSLVDNNYSDLAKCNFTIYLTTNYDHIIQKYISSDFTPINLKDIHSNMQSILTDKENKRVFHLHGNISDESSIVLTRESYDNLYQNNVYSNLFSILSGCKTFIFVGFSFNDVFIQNVIKDNYKYFKSKHYIILANPDKENIKFLKENYNIEVIEYNPENSTHQIEIRNILNDITTSNKPVDKIDGDSVVENIELDELPTNKQKEILENDLFCKKLRIENITDKRVNYSKNCFFTADQYFRWLKRSGIKDSDMIADYMLKLSYMQYEKCFTMLFEENRDSNELWKNVHNLLSKMDLNKLKQRINEENLPNDINKQGFVHILANETKKEREVWWGDKRSE